MPNHVAIALLAAVLCISCSSPSSGQRPIVAGHYQFSTADLRIDLDLAADGKYHASMDCSARVTEEHGSWGMEGDNIILKARSGGLQMSMRRLGTLRQASAHTLRIVEPDSQISRAIVLTKS